MASQGQRRDSKHRILHINVFNCKTTKFRNTKSCMKQNVKHFVVLVVNIVIMHELQELLHLFLRYCLWCCLR